MKFPKVLLVTQAGCGAEDTYLVPHGPSVEDIPADEDGTTVAVYEFVKTQKLRVTRVLA